VLIEHSIYFNGGIEIFFTMSIIDIHNHGMCKVIYTSIILSLIIMVSSAGLFGNDPIMKPGFLVAVNNARAANQADEEIPLTFKSVIGNWSLKYSGNYGYNFSFYSNYRALVVLYLNMETLIFKGVYTIEDGNKLKINIYEMKEEHRAGGVKKGFVKAKSSYFLFGGNKIRKNGKETLNLRPLAIIIDGNNSEGYFEPLIKLAKS
jgi:hypothetical protein